VTVPHPKPALQLVPPRSATDAELCRSFLDGDTQAFGELVRRHQDTVFRLVRRYAPTLDDARDLSQRAFLQAFEAARRTMPRMLRGADAVPFRAWLLRIAVNLGKNHARDLRRWPSAPVAALEHESSPGPKAHERLERAESEALTRQAVLLLPKRQREVFALRIDAGLPFADVASTLGITEVNAKTHFHYAVKRLRDEVQRLSGEPKS
jgi:RNA polymerase sigma-70 factor (ECF subfamily)